MKVKLQHILIPEVASSLSEISKHKLPAKVWYKINSIINTANEENKKYQEFRSTLIKKYAKLDEKGELLIVNGKFNFETPENAQNFRDETSEYLSIEIETPQISLKDIENIEIEGNKILPLFGTIIENV